jgi:hypothetical protein
MSPRRWRSWAALASIALVCAIAGACTVSGDEASDDATDAECAQPTQFFARHAWSLSGEVADVAVHCDTIYVAGGPGTVGPRTGPLVAVSGRTGRRVGRLPELSGEIGEITGAEPLVVAMVEDGRGGWFVAGGFAFADDRRCPGLVHVLRSGVLDRGFCPRTNGPVDVLTRAGDSLFLGGAFTRVGGLARKHLAAVDAGTGAVLAWSPGLEPARYCPDREEP